MPQRIKPLHSLVAVMGLVSIFATQARADDPPPVPHGHSIPLIDLADQEHRQVVVDREPDQYLGHTLKLLPSAMIHRATWREAHPGATVAMLSRTSREYRNESLDEPSRFLIGIAGGGKAGARPFDRRQGQPVVSDRISGWPLRVAFDPEPDGIAG